MKQKEFNLSEKIDNYFEIELLDSMVDVQSDIKLILKEFIEKLKAKFREDVFIEDFMISIKEIDKTINNMVGDKLV